MDERILEFIGDLRRAELRISPSEALDALTAATEIGLSDRETFKTALASTLVKEGRDRETFDRIFNLYFLDLQALGEGLKKALGPEDPRVQELIDRLTAEEEFDLDEMTELLLRGQGAEMEMAIRAGGQNAGLERLMYFLQVGYFSRRIADGIDLAAVEQDIDRLMRALEARGLDPGQLARVRNYLELRLEALRRMIRQHVERELERRAWRQGERLTREVLSDKPLFALTPDEVAQMKAVVAKLARKIKDALALRQRQEQRGRLDTRKTMRESLSYGGIPMEVFLKRRHREKPKLITVCDVSDSVRNAAVHAATGLEPPGVLQPRAVVRVRVRDGGSHPGVQHVPGRARDRVGAQGRARRLSLPLGLRLRVRPVRPQRARYARQKNHRVGARRRAQQLQRSAGVGAPDDARAGEGHHLAEPRGPVGLGRRRQRDAALRAGVRRRARVPDHRPDRRGRRQPRPLVVAAGPMSLVRALAAVLLTTTIATLVGSPGARAQGGDCITIDNFAKGKAGEFPPEWKPRKDEGRDVYKIAEDGGLRFLRAVAKGLGIQAAREFAWISKRTPCWPGSGARG
ncbi:MAG: VWA domain-containing protein, partial [Candidatus Rokubacteria bacterium]|nr:VWA domain-containing protein [Candidatus Rokubacteria bacterium]